MKKSESKNQLLFNQLLDEVDQKIKKENSKDSLPKNEAIPPLGPDKINEKEQDKIKEKRKELVQQRYTKYCIEWMLGLHIKTRLTSDFIPHIDKILPFYRTKVYEKEHNFLSALVGFKEYHGAYLYLNHPNIQKILFSEKAPLLLNMNTLRQDLKKEITSKNPFKNKDFSNLLDQLGKVYGTPKLMQMILFDEAENTPLNLQKKACFSKDGSRQTALSFLISQGAWMQSLDYMYSLPKETTLAEVCALLDDPIASKELKRVASRKNFKNQDEVVFLNTLEKNLPTESFLRLTQQYQGVAQYKEEDLTSHSLQQKAFHYLKNKTNTHEK